MKYLIIGGTGSLGSKLIERLYDGKRSDIVCFSRDELKQQKLKNEYKHVTYVIGDVRDRASLKQAMRGVDVVFHVAALKHVDVLEANPTEAVKTNVEGTINVAEAAIEAGVRHVVFSSTDKAVLPINVYGMTKALSERYLFDLNSKQTDTKFAVYRWGNVLGSRGSVLHTFTEAFKNKTEIRITDRKMSRFWIHIDDAVDFMLETFKNAQRAKAMIPHMKAALVMNLMYALGKVLKCEDVLELKIIGIRSGEKIHECLHSDHDYCLRSDTCDQYSEAELINLIRRSL